MHYKEYQETLKYELFRFYKGKLTLFQRIRIKYFQPNTNCIYLARKMWYLHEKGRISQIRSKLIYLKIIKKYGCIIFPTAQIGKGFHITHPTGIVLGNCKAGKDFMIYQNCSIGGKTPGNDWPQIGDNVQLCTNSIVLGHIKIVDNVVIGAQSLVINNIEKEGVYAGNPLRKIR